MWPTGWQYTKFTSTDLPSATRRWYRRRSRRGSLGRGRPGRGHVLRRPPGQLDHPGGHRGERDDRDRDAYRTAGELLLEQPDAQHDAGQRVDDDQQRLGHAQRPRMQCGLLEQRARERGAEPRIAPAVSSATAPPNASRADSHSAVSGLDCPPLGSATDRNTPSVTQTTAAATQAERAMSWRNHIRRISSTKTSSVTRRGWTTDSFPSRSATAWNTKPPTAATQPSSQSGCRNR